MAQRLARLDPYTTLLRMVVYTIAIGLIFGYVNAHEPTSAVVIYLGGAVLMLPAIALVLMTRQRERRRQRKLRRQVEATVDAIERLRREHESLEAGLEAERTKIREYMSEALDNPGLYKDILSALTTHRKLIFTSYRDVDEAVRDLDTWLGMERERHRRRSPEQTDIPM
jgi:hypothetical protein